MKRETLTTLEEFEELYRARFHSFLRVAEGITGDVERSKDAVQEGFARAIRRRSEFRREAELETWVWRCVVNAARGSRTTQEIVWTEELVDPVGETSLDEGSTTALIAALPERQRLCLFLRYYADLDYRTIADVLGVELGTVGAMLNKAHATLRRQLKEVPKG